MATMKDNRAAAATPLPDGRPADLSGVLLGNDFMLQRRLGEGGMGQVYLAEQISLKRRVAVKLLRHELARDGVSRKRFETEAKAVAQLSHPNIVQVYAVGEQDGILYMALEYVEGWTLKEFLTRKGPPELPIALSIMRQVAGALARAAEIGIIHRDIKPENLLITRKVEVKVTDFGLSRIIGQAEGLNLTQTGHAMGTPLYMSPEQVMGQPLDVRTDLYSFGATCYHLLTGQPPFMGETAIAVGFKHVQEEPTPVNHFRSDVPGDLALIVSRLMAKKPENRYQSARELLRDLKMVSESILGGGGSAAGLALSGLSGSRPIATPPIEESPPPGKLRAPEPPVDPLLATVRALPRREERKRQAWVPWILGASLVGAIVLGGLVGQWLKSGANPDVAPTFATTPTPAPISPEQVSTVPTAPASLDEMEARLRSDLDPPPRPGGARPPNPAALINRGLERRIELAALFLYPPPALNLPPQLDRAEQFAQELMKAVVSPYRALGEWLHAIVLVEQKKTAAGRDAMLKALDAKFEFVPGQSTGDEFARLHAARNNRFNHMLTESLTHLEKQLGGTGKLPARLDSLLKHCRDQQVPEGDSPRPTRPGRAN
ncbi:MAG TPA: protein kinase [Gemmatales bacterium]|nr:protein kinase [Gemmatales bacterium]